MTKGRFEMKKLNLTTLFIFILLLSVDIHALDTPVKILPTGIKNCTQPVVFFQWQNPEPGLISRIQLSKTKNFSKPAIDRYNLMTDTISIRLPDYFSTYYYRIKCYSVQETSDWTVIDSIKTGLKPPKLLYPDSNATKVPLYTHFKWEWPTGALTFEIQVSPMPNVINDFGDKYTQGEIGIPTNDFMIKYLKPRSVYYWKVRAYNGDCVSDWSNEWRMFMDTIGPQIPNLIFPTDHSVKQATNVTFKWDTANRAYFYKIQLSTDQSFKSIILSKDSIYNTNFNKDTLNNGQNYYWRVCATNDSGTTRWSDIWTFKTIKAIPVNAPVAVYPVNTDTVNVNGTFFRWTYEPLAESYHLQLSTDTTFEQSTLLIDDIGVYDSTRYINNLDFNKTYFWRVKSIDEAGASPWSSVAEFRTVKLTDINSEGCNFNDYRIENNGYNSIKISYDLNSDQTVKIDLYSIDGHFVRNIINEYQNQGYHSIELGDNFQNGVYCIFIKSKNSIQVQKLIISR